MKIRTASSLALALLLAFGLAAGTAPARAASRAAQPRAADPGDAKPAPVDVNTATASDLESIPGIGRALAQRIVDFRGKNGAFESVDDLLKVQGIGEKSLAKLRPYLTVAKAK